MDRERVTQFHKEAESWKRILEYIQAENNHLKMRIADIVSRDISKEILMEVEDFQNRFIRKDEMIVLARKDIRDFALWITAELTHTMVLNAALKKQQKLRMEMETLEQQFNKLKFQFHNYIAENF